MAVIGATGFIGSHLVERLASRGAYVLPIARTDRQRANLIPANCAHTLQTCDILDQDALTAMLVRFKPHKVFHLACQPDAAETPAHAEACIRVNTLGAVTVARAAQESGASRVIFADSVKVHGNIPGPARSDSATDPICSYAVSKTAAWQLLKTLSASTSTDVVSLRSTFVYGPRQQWNLIAYVAECARAGVPVRLQGGSQTRDPLYVSDAVDAFIRAAYAEPASRMAIPIGGGEELSVKEICRRVLAVMGSDVPVHEGALGPRATEIWRCHADNRDAKRLLGWTPETSLQQGLEAILGKSAVTTTARSGS